MTTQNTDRIKRDCLKELNEIANTILGRKTTKEIWFKCNLCGETKHRATEKSLKMVIERHKEQHKKMGDISICEVLR